MTEARLFKPIARALASRLVSGSATSLAAKLAGTGMGMLASIVFARHLGVAGFGVLAVALSWASLLEIPAGLGLRQMLVRNVAAFTARKDWGLAKGAIVWSGRATLGSALIVSLLVFLVAKFALAGALLGTALAIASALVAFRALSYRYSAILRGLGQILYSELPSSLVRPGITLALAVALWQLAGAWSDAYRGPSFAVMSHAAATAVAVVLGVVLLRKSLPREVATARAEFDGRAWLMSAGPLVVIQAMYVVQAQADMVMLGALSGMEASGFYRAASRAASLLLFPIQATNVASATMMADYHATNQRSRLQRLVWHTGLLNTAVTTLMAVPLALGSRIFLGLFGPEFVTAQTPLFVLMAATMLNVACGPVSLLLVMAGRERISAVAVVLAAGVNIVLNAALIPPLGPLGAALATASSMLFWNVYLVLAVRRHLGLNPTILGAWQVLVSNRHPLDPTK